MVFGCVLGVAGALPAMYLFELALRKVRPVSVGAGLASVAVSFLMLSAAIFVVRLVSPADVLPFGAAAVLTFLCVWTVEAVRAWKDAQR